jgi:hypothetical protein
MMSKKGEGMSVTTVLIVIICILVLAIVIYGLTSFFNGHGIPFFSNLPEFNNTKAPAGGFREVRYDISTDSVQYFDGKWESISGSAQLGNTDNSYLVSEKDLKTAFNAYYFNQNNRPLNQKIFQNAEYAVTTLYLENSASPQLAIPDSFWSKFTQDIGNSIGGNVYEAWAWLSHNPTYHDTTDYSRGTITLSILKLNVDGSYGSFAGFIFVNPDGKLNQIDGGTKFSVQQTTETATSWFGSSGVSFTGEEQSQITSKAIVWRDIILTKPIPVTYKLNGKDDTKLFCVKNYGTNLVIEDLSKPSTSTTCPV